MTGIKHEDLVRFAVAVPVVVLEVDCGIGQLTCFRYHFLGMIVITVQVVSTIIGIVFRHRHRADDIYVEIELAVTLVMEVVAHAATETERGIGIVLSVHDLLVEGKIM